MFRLTTTSAGRRHARQALFVLAAGIAIWGLVQPARAATTIYVRPDGSDTLCDGTADAQASNAPACAVATIAVGVTLVDAGGVVNVAAGTYNVGDPVSVSKSLTLRGANAGIDARTISTRNPESIIDGGGHDTPFAIMADNVIIDGFTIRGGSGAFGAGVWMAKQTNTHIRNNIIADNVIGVYVQGTSVIMQYNRFEANNRPGPAGGTAFYSESSTNFTFDQNEVRFHTNNTPMIFASVGPPSHFNVTFSNNSVYNNTLAAVYALSISGGVFRDNYFIANGVSGGQSGALAFDGSDSNISVVSNTFYNQPLAVRIGLRNDHTYTYGQNSNITVNFNRIYLHGNAIRNLGNYAGTLNAENNWWGCNSGPGTTGCDTSSGAVDANPWLTLTLSATPSATVVGAPATLTGSLATNSDESDTSASGYLANGTPIAFATSLGSIVPPQTTTVSGRATSLFTAATPGAGTFSATLDSQTVTAPIAVAKANTSTTLAVQPNPSRAGQAITASFTVMPVAPGAGTPTGTVTISGGGASCTATVAAGSCNLTPINLGNTMLLANYPGDGSFNPSSASVPHRVGVNLYLPVVMHD